MVFCELSLSRIVQRQDSDRNCDRVNLLPNKAECTLAIKATLTPEHQLFLIRANKSRPSGEWSADDYDVRDEHQVHWTVRQPGSRLAHSSRALRPNTLFAELTYITATLR
jgi:hypothetical protein